MNPPEGDDPPGASRADRRRAIYESAQQYADQMERMLRLYPLEWFNFESFLGPEISN